MNSLTLFLSFCLILITNSPSLTNANGSDLISQICKASVNQKECTDILTAYPRIMHANNFFELAEAILQLSLYKAIEGQKFLRTLMKSENVPAIAQCANSDYESVITAYKSALSKLKDDPKTAKHYARDAGNGPVSWWGWNRVRATRPKPHLGNRVGNALDETNPKTMQDLGNHHEGWCAFSECHWPTMRDRDRGSGNRAEALPEAWWHNQNKKKGKS
ncbi:hypothetical protein D0Y65_005140 [Glycine soja]|uniref:Pectinesterase inhibitor domain-containing protein n=1 Tax=Glycine soja TaxID=3848 RepID=A0A445LUD1_GLYSO|nr:hypothetical protein D0Y65_005140 [Glycine soja]